MKLFRLAEKIVPDLPVSQEYYENNIEVWKQIYKGYFKDWHDVTVNIGGTKSTRRMASMQVAKLICAEMSSLVFTEKVDIKIKDDDQSTEYVQEILKNNDFTTKQSELYEYGFAMGGGVNNILRQNDETVIEYIVADKYIPTKWNNRSIDGAIIVDVSYRGEWVYYLVSDHNFENNVVTINYALYRAKQNAPNINEGQKVPLDTLYPDMMPTITIDPMKMPTHSYFKPNIGNNVDLDTPLGISIFANSLDTLKSIDIAFDSFQREFVLGKKKIIVPTYALKSVTDPVSKQTYNYYDDTIDIYHGLNMGKDAKDFNFKDDTQTLRVEDHIGAINALLNILCIQVGVTPGFVSFDAKNGLKTATEVVSENSKTYRTKQKHEKAIKKNLTEIVEIILSIGAMYNENTYPENYELEITFDDSIIEDKTAERQRDAMEVVQGNMAKWEFRVKWYGQTEEEAKAFVKEYLTPDFSASMSMEE